MTVTYIGPECPYCGLPFSRSELHDGEMTCRGCRKRFEAAVFQPVEFRQRPVEVLVATPDGVANACANHARNAAVTNCQRCGLFICELCDLNLGEGSYCPSCFDRVRAEGTLKATATRYRDHASMARVTVVLGFLFSTIFLGLPFGALAAYYASKGIKQRRDEGASAAGMIVVMVLGILQMAGSIVMIAILFGNLT